MQKTRAREPAGPSTHCPPGQRRHPTYPGLTLLRWTIGGWLVLVLGGCSLPALSFAPAEPTVTAAPVPTAPTLPPDAPPPPAATLTVTPPPPPTPTATPPTIADYRAYRVQPQDTLASISARGGTTPELLQRYNRLTSAPQVGRELIVPRLEGQASRLPDPWLLVIRGNTVQPWVALTFDCGGETLRADDILDALQAADAQVTFFVLGESIGQRPELLHRMVAEGHELANLSYTHTDLTTLTDAQIADELAQTEAAVQSLLGPAVSTRPYVRLPFGAYDERTLRAVIANGYLPVHWTLDALDTVGEPKSADFLVERITSSLAPDELRGAIILAHCTGSTADALPRVLASFDAAGFAVHTLSDVLGP